MRGWSLLNAGPNREDVHNAEALFEAALRIDPDNSQANVGLAQVLIRHTYRMAPLPERATLLARADEAATRATAVAPDSAQAQSVKAEILGLQQRFDAALATYDRAIALDRNLSNAHVGRARSLIAAGRAGDAVAPVERAIRLSPRDPDLYLWYYVACHAYTHLARDAAAIEWCLKSVATGKTFGTPGPISPPRTPGAARRPRPRPQWRRSSSCRPGLYPRSKWPRKDSPTRTMRRSTRNTNEYSRVYARRDCPRDDLRPCRRGEAGSGDLRSARPPHVRQAFAPVAPRVAEIAGAPEVTGRWRRRARKRRELSSL